MLKKSVKPWQLGLICNPTLSQKLFWGKLHLKQNSVNKLSVTAQGFVCPKCYNAFGYNREPMICKP